MKFCLKYSNFCGRLPQADEISILYIEDKGLLDFLEKFNDKRINLRVDSKDFSDIEINKLKAIKNTYPSYDFSVAINCYDEEFANKLIKNNLPFYFDYPICSWEELNVIIKNMKVTDIIIGGQLGFELPTTVNFIRKYNPDIHIRAIANLSTDINEFIDGLIGFYIRPEDLDIYSQYIDVIEFIGLSKQDLFFDIYKSGLYIGSLGQIIHGIDLIVDNTAVPPILAERRVNCERKCLRGYRCNLCNNFANVSIDLGKKIKETAIDTVIHNIKNKSNKN